MRKKLFDYWLNTANQYSKMLKEPSTKKAIKLWGGYFKLLVGFILQEIADCLFEDLWEFIKEVLSH